MPGQKKTTIYDIATEARMSASTVASVLNGSWKKRRIGVDTAQAILAIAGRTGYSANLQARGLRQSRSGLIGMIVPMLDNRFFSSLAQAFEGLARANGLYPVLVSTLRDTRAERDTVKALISHNVEGLFVCGATDPDALSDICEQAGVRHINVDLPGTRADSVISDNFGGARRLTADLLQRAGPLRQSPRLRFIGGIAGDHNTCRRIDGFAAALGDAGRAVQPGAITTCGYDAALSESAMRAMHLELGGLPDVLFINSSISFEGVVRFLCTLPVDDVRACAIGCFDWDPYIELLHFPVSMVRQNVTQLVADAYRLLASPRSGPGTVHLVPTQFVPAGTQAHALIAPPVPSGRDRPSGRRTSA